MGKNFFSDAKIRLLQFLARNAPGATSLRPRLHRWRGVTMGTNVWVSPDVIIETAYPHLVSIGDNVDIGIRTTIVGHFRGKVGRDEKSVRIENDVFIGPGVIILPNVTIGQGAVVTAGSVVARSVPPMTMVRGNPAEPIAKCGVPLGRGVPYKEFSRKLRPIRKGEKSK